MNDKITTIGAIRLRDVLVGKNTNAKPVNKKSSDGFVIIPKNDIGYIYLKCSQCENGFGVDNSFMDMVGEANFRYVCPYCHLEGSIKEQS